MKLLISLKIQKKPFLSYHIHCFTNFCRPLSENLLPIEKAATGLIGLAFRQILPNLCLVQATIIIMTEHQISLIKNSWNQVRSIDPVLVGDVFYSKLFVEAPELYHLFKTPRPEQSKKLIGMISVVVAKLDKLSDLTHDIEQLAKRHVRYGTQPEHYAVVGGALLWTLEVGLGTSWNSELKEAWSICYGILSSTMIKASEYATETVLS